VRKIFLTGVDDLCGSSTIRLSVYQFKNIKTVGILIVAGNSLAREQRLNPYAEISYDV
jgi:hypothetical protein